MWQSGQTIVPEITIQPDLTHTTDQVVIKNLRDFVYTPESRSFSGDQIQEKYKTLTISTESITGATLFVAPFDFLPVGAHIFVSFQIKDQESIAVSFEARRKIGQDYSPLKGLFNIYPLMAVVGTERDIVSLREDLRKNKVFKYPLKLSREKAQDFFRKIMTEAQNVNSHQFSYNTLFYSCVTITIAALNHVRSKKIGYGLKVLFSAYIPSVFRSHKLID